MCELPINGKLVFERRYLMRNPDGSLKETVEDCFLRVARHIAKNPANGDSDSDAVRQLIMRYFNLMFNLEFMPNTPTFTGAGTPLGQLAACFVLRIEDDIGKDSPQGIFATLLDAALIQQSGGGIGFSFSNLRPKGDIVSKSGGMASGPVSFMQVYNTAFGAIAQGGTRRGASMACLRVDHPDIEEFINCKAEDGKLSNFNISVLITDKFMKAFEEGDVYDLVNPRTGRTTTSVSAKKIMDMIVTAAHRNGEPGLLFIDRINKYNPLPHLYQIESTNPCGEQALGPYENCCLGSINLARHVDKANRGVDWKKLEATIHIATRFLDDVVSVNNYIPKVSELRAAAWRGRRIGLGFMGLADMLMVVGGEYGEATGILWAGEIAEFIQYHSMLESIELAKERGPFPAITGSIFDPKNLKWQPPTHLPPFVATNLSLQMLGGLDTKRPPIDWSRVVDGIKAFGIRNSAHTTVAPTGTIGTVAGVEGYGIEPMFSLSYTRYVNQGEGKIELKYASKMFEWMLDQAKIDRRSPEAIDAVERGSCAGDERFPLHFRRVCATAGDIPPIGHIRMQAAVQHFFSNSISKTINMPAGTSKDGVIEAYSQAWNLGCRGITVYVAGSRENEVLVTNPTPAK